MKRFGSLVLSLLMAVLSNAQWKYPPTKTVDATDTYFGKTYKDPYRWLENLKDKDVEAWFKAQAEMTDGLLAKIPGRDGLAQEWMNLDKLQPATYTDIRYEHGRVFYKKTLGGENVGKLFFREGWNGAEKLLFDPTPYKAGVTTTIRQWFHPLTVITWQWGSRQAEPSTRRYESWTWIVERCCPKTSILPTGLLGGHSTAKPSSTTPAR